MLLAASLISGSIAAQAAMAPLPVSVSISGVSVTETVVAINPGADASATVTDSTVTVATTGNNAQARGVSVFSEDGNSSATVTNSTITASTTGNNASAYGVSVYSKYGNSSATVTNSTITASTTGTENATGVFAFSVHGDSSAAVTNSTVTASTTGAGSAVGLSAYSGSGDSSTTVTNSTITATSTGDGSNNFGVNASSHSGTTTLIANSTIAASATGTGSLATGVFAGTDSGASALSIANSTITASTAGGAGSHAVGVLVRSVGGTSAPSIANSTITATTTGAGSDAFGVESFNQFGGTNALSIANSTITASATGAESHATGVSAFSSTAGANNTLSIANSTITASATDGDGIGIQAVSTSGTGSNTITLVNSMVTGSSIGIKSLTGAASTISIDRTSTVYGGDYAISADAQANVTVSGLVSGRMLINNLATGSTATLRANFDTARDNTLVSENPYFDILGTATLANGTTFNIHPANNLLAPGASDTYYLLHSANPATWSQANLNLTYGPLMNVSWAGDPMFATTDLAVTIAVKDFTTLAGSGLTTNGFAALQDLYNNHPGKFDINGNPETWIPDASGAVVTGMVGMQGGASSLISQHLQQVASVRTPAGGKEESGINSGDAAAVRGFWGEVWYTDAKQDTSDGINGYDANTVNLTVGYDQEILNGSRLGLAFTRGDSNVGTQSTANGVKSLSHILTLYGKHAIGPWQTQAALSAGVATNDAIRYADSERITADYDSKVYGANVTAGYLLGNTGAWRLQPQAAINYSHIAIDGYTENGDGTGTSKALQVQSQDYDVFEIGAGVNVQREFKIGKGILRPEAEAMVYRDLVGDQIQATSSFVGGNTSFVTLGRNPEQTSWKLDIGLNYEVENNVSFRVGYNYTGRDDFQANSVNAKLRYEF